MESTLCWTMCGSAKGARRGATARAVIVDALPDVKAAYEAAQTAVTNYKSTFDSIRSQWLDERQRLLDAQAVVWSPTLYFPPDPRAPIDILLRANAQRIMIEAEGSIMALAQQRQAADEAFVAAMNRALPASWESTRAAYAAIGITSLADLTPNQIAIAMAALARDASLPDNAAARAQLAELLDIYGTDQAIMSTLFQELGGAKTVDLINTLGAAVHPGGDQRCDLEPGAATSRQPRACLVGLGTTTFN